MHRHFPLERPCCQDAQDHTGIVNSGRQSYPTTDIEENPQKGSDERGILSFHNFIFHTVWKDADFLMLFLH